MDLTTADWVTESNSPVAHYAWSVASAGDVNADGYADVIIGEPHYPGSAGFGFAYVYLGSAAGLATTAGWVHAPNDAVANTGFAVDGGGDVNGDGVDDVLVASPYVNEGDPSCVSVFHGSAAGLGVVASTTLEADEGWTEYGRSSAFAGDVNGDGYGDVVVGAPYDDDGSFADRYEGRAFLYLGSATGLSPSEAWTVESNNQDSLLGWSVSSAGDVNDDGFDDVILGAPYMGNGSRNEGQAFVFLGSAVGLEAAFAWSAESNQADALFGDSVSSAGDVNDDGFDDVIVGAFQFENGESKEGRAYLYLGSATGLGTIESWSFEGNAAGVRVGASVASAGDFNADGIDDVVVGSTGWSVTAIDEGAALVFLGAAAGLSTDPQIVLGSGQAESSFGWAVASAGDTNGDGYDDIVVGAPDYDNGSLDEGRAFLFHGGCADPVDSDGDLIGDSCDVCPGFDDLIDTDGDGFADGCDSCPEFHDPANSPDADGDGFCAAEECDDTSAAVHPGAFELCDGLDNDCSGSLPVDERDEDGDGEPLCAGDCDDADPTLFTGQTEACNGRDDNCDGAPSPDERDADLDGLSACAGDCDDQKSFAHPEVAEICGDGYDNNCDGAADEGCVTEDESPGCSCDGTAGGAASPLWLVLLLRRIRRRPR